MEAISAASRLALAPARIELLGLPRLLLGDCSAHPLERRDAALLAMLALQGPTPRSRVLALLWSDVPLKTAQTNLRQRLFRLKQRAGFDLVVTDGPLALADGLQHDLDAGAPTPLMWTGHATSLLGDLDYEDCGSLTEWVATARAHWQAGHRQRLAHEAARLEGIGSIADALAYAERLAVDEPTAEHAHRRVMRLHYRRGDRAAALAAFERCRAALERTLGAAPGAETRALAELIERSGELPAPVASPSPVAVLRPPRIVGRDAEWRRLDTLLLQHGIGLIEGEPGIGKTRLLRDFTDAQRQAVIVGALSGDALLPHALLARMVRALVRAHGAPPTPWVVTTLSHLAPELGTASGAIDPLRLTQAVVQALADWRTAAGLSMLTLDDLQFADAASLALLPAIVAASSQEGVCWLIAARVQERSPAVVAALAAFDARVLERIPLAPLDAISLKALLVSLRIDDFDAVGWTSLLAAHTGGNPLFVLETLRVLLEERPDALRRAPARLPTPRRVGELIDRKLGQLTPRARRLTQVAALAGQDFDARVGAAVLGEHVLDVADTWRELESALITLDNRFAHDLIREGALRSIPAPVGAVLHVEIAAALEAAGTAPPARIAGHWFQSGAWERAAGLYLKAAKLAWDASRDIDAAPWFESAAECFGRSGLRSEQRQALQELIACQVRRHDIAGARRAAAQLPALAAGHPESEAWAFERVCEVATIARDDALALQSARRALAAAPEPENGWITFNCTRKLCLALAHQGQFAESLQHFGSQQAWLDANADHWNVDVWHCSHAYVLHLADRRTEAIAVHDLAARQALAHGNWYCVYAAWRDLAQTRHWQGDLQGALDASAQALTLGDRLGAGVTLHNPRDAARRAMLLRDAGHHAESIALLETSLATLAAADSPFWHAFCEDQLALGYLAVGQVARAGVLIKGEPRCDNIEAQATRRLARAAWVRLATGHVDATLLAADLYQRADCPRRWRLLALLEASHGLAPADAWLACRSVADEAGRHELDGVAMHARVLAGHAGARCGAGAEAAADLASALVLLQQRQRHPTGLSMAEMLWRAAQAFEALGQTQQAGSLLTRAARRLLDVEMPHVPAAFRHGFSNRHPAHCALLAAAQQLSS